MLRALPVVCASILLSACSVGYVSLPFVQSKTDTATIQPGRELPAGVAGTDVRPRMAAAQKPTTALGGPPLTADAAAITGSTVPSPPSRSASEAEAALALINRLRATHGLPPLVISPLLTTAAAEQATSLARSGQLVHIGPDGSTPLDRVRRTGFRPRMAAENIAGGQTIVADAIRSWQASETHLANLLLPDATHMGLAMVAEQRPQSRRAYWTLVLGRPL